MDKIICVGKNYLDHAHEMGGAIPTAPLFFFKPPSALRRLPGPSGGPPVEVVWPKRDVHFECELVLAIGANGQFTHYAVGLDMTLRDQQSALKKAGHPWERAKVFTNAAVISPLLTLTHSGSLEEVLDLELKLMVNGRTRQRARPREMRVDPTELLRELETLFPLVEGDLLFTGTPAGVGPVVEGDQLDMSIGSEQFSVKAVLR